MDRTIHLHPGEILKQEFLEKYRISSSRLSKGSGIPQLKISQIIKGTRSINADTANRLSKYFGNLPEFWIGLQQNYDSQETDEAGSSGS